MQDPAGPASAGSPAIDRTATRAVGIFSWLLLAVGAIARVAPLFDQGGRVWRQFPTEDGYLMLTIARNLSLGHGMTIADGTIPTNGTQPLATGVWATLFWLTGSSKFWGVFLVQLVEIGIAAAGAWCLFVLARRLLVPRQGATAFATLAAAAWFASPVVVRHSMNCLESGIYALSVLVVLLVVLRPPAAERSGPELRRWAGIGILLAIAFWARNDAVFLCLAVGGAHLLGMLPAAESASRERFARRLVEVAVAASVVTVLAAPWLLNNWLGFGSLVPISGQAESLRATFGGNLWILPVMTFEYITLFLPVPAALEWRPLVVAGSTTVVAAAVVLGGIALRRLPQRSREVALVGALFALALAGFYGLYFGVGHFMSRYLFPVSALFALAWATLWMRLADPASLPLLRGMGRAWTPLYVAGLVAVLALAIGLNARIYANGADHQHFQVVDWIEANVPDEEWVGAVQTGTLGFFHDRTINLDGKVNPMALEARRTDDVPRYIAKSSISYLADWAGISDWLSRPEIAENFELIVLDEARNLAVFRRTGVREAQATR